MFFFFFLILALCRFLCHGRKQRLAGGVITRRALINQPPIDWLAGWQLASGLKKGQSEVLIGRRKARQLNLLFIDLLLVLLSCFHFKIQEFCCAVGFHSYASYYTATKQQRTRQ